MKRGRESSKSRSGCKTCKERKIKCDESKPACDACTRSRILCPGYARPLKWSRKHEVHASLPAMASLSSPLSTNRPYESRRDMPASDSASRSSCETNTHSAATYASNAVSSLPEWSDLDLNGADTELAFQDAAVLMSQELTTTTAPSFIYTGFPIPGMSLNSNGNDNSSEQNSEPGSGTVESSDYIATLFLGVDDNDGSGLSRDVVIRPSDTGNKTTNRSRTTGEAQGASRGSCALLHTFYRLSSPQSFRRPSDDELVRYYFNHVCRLHSCFDSDENRFRALAVKWWSTCPTISLILQSMAIAHITNWYPYMAALGVSKRCQAWRSLQKDLQLQRLGRVELNQLLLCLFLLGISVGWQQVSLLGLPYLHIARNLIQNKLREGTLHAETHGLSDFWASSLVYWEMMAGFVDPVKITVFDGHGVPELSAQALNGSVKPHPWTGISTELHFILAEIGRVSRRRQGYAKSAGIPTGQERPDDLDHGWLQKLEQLLLTTEIPSEERIEDFKDPTTSKLDFIQTAEAYRGVGLLEVYRLCPKLLYSRLDEKGTGRSSIPFALPEDHSDYSDELDSYLASIAVHTTGLFAKIGISSGVCRAQPLLMVACSSQLRLPDRSDMLADPEGTGRHDEILAMRALVENRILALSRKMPQAPILRAMDIINEVWDRIDNGQDGWWMNVMHEKGWQVIFG